MKFAAKALAMVGFISASVITSFGQPAFSFDEFGNVTGPGLSGGVVLPADPSGGVPGPVLTFTVAMGLTQGDLLLDEVVQSSHSDVIRFWNPLGNPNQSLIIFYSDLPETNEFPVPLADKGLPVNILPNLAVVPEIGTEAVNFANYTAAPGMPGGVFPTLPGPNIQYSIISDGVVPEPTSLALALVGGGLMWTLKRRSSVRK